MSVPCARYGESARGDREREWVGEVALVFGGAVAIALALAGQSVLTLCSIVVGILCYCLLVRG